MKNFSLSKKERQEEGKEVRRKWENLREKEEGKGGKEGRKEGRKEEREEGKKKIVLTESKAWKFCTLEQRSPTFLASGTGFVEDSFWMDQGVGGEGDSYF